MMILKIVTGVLLTILWSSKRIDKIQRRDIKVFIKVVVLLIFIILLFSFTNNIVGHSIISNCYSNVTSNHIIAIAAIGTLIFSIWTFRKNNEFIRKQQFETTFFNMMRQVEDIVSKLTYKQQIVNEYLREKKIDYKGEEILNPVVDTILSKGRDVFEYLYKEIRIIYFEQENLIKGINLTENKELNDIIESAKKYYSPPIGFKGVIDLLGIKGYENIKDIHILDHYFRYLYRIMKFVDEAEYLENDKNYRDERYKYMGILRATLSPYELVLLFYNNLSKYGNEKVKPLIEKYSMFKSLRPELLANTIRDYNLELIDDIYNSDYDRYIAFDEKDNGYLRYDQSVKYKEQNKHILNKW